MYRQVFLKFLEWFRYFSVQEVLRIYYFSAAFFQNKDSVNVSFRFLFWVKDLQQGRGLMQSFEFSKF